MMKLEYNSLIKTLDEYGSYELVIEWESGLKITGTPATLYETNNGLEDDDTNYVEYYAVACKRIYCLTQSIIQVVYIIG